MVSREPRQLVGFDVSMEKSAKYIQGIVDHAPDAKFYCSDGYVGYLDVVYLCMHIRGTRNKRVTRSLSKVSTLIRDITFLFLPEEADAFLALLKRSELSLRFLLMPTIVSI